SSNEHCLEVYHTLFPHNHRSLHGPLFSNYLSKARLVLPNMSSLDSANEIHIVIAFGVVSVLVALASLHYRDSLCCFLCQVLYQVVSRDDALDTEATAGATTYDQASHNDTITMQPQRSDRVHLMYQPSTTSSNYTDELAIISTVTSTPYSPGTSNVVAGQPLSPMSSSRPSHHVPLDYDSRIERPHTATIYELAA
ncbi:hypothetical protein P153DRAFT_406464, partial [Dothidotthia symphoricarpi CBS 119687]